MDVGLRQEGVLRHQIWESPIRVHLAHPGHSLNFCTFPVLARRVLKRQTLAAKVHEGVRLFETAGSPGPEIDVHIERPFNLSGLRSPAQPDRGRSDIQKPEENRHSRDLCH